MLEEDKSEHKSVKTDSSAASPYGDASEDTTIENAAGEKIDDQQWYLGEIEMDNQQWYVNVKWMLVYIIVVQLVTQLVFKTWSFRYYLWIRSWVASLSCLNQFT